MHPALLFFYFLNQNCVIGKFSEFFNHEILCFIYEIKMIFSHVLSLYDLLIKGHTKLYAAFQKT